MASTGLTAESLVRRDRLILLSGAGLLAGIAWWSMARSHAHGPADLATAFSAWMVMMVAMMLPPVMPWILLFGAASRDRRSGERPFAVVAVFTAGYFTIWAIYSLAAAALQVVLHRHAWLQAGGALARPAGGGLLVLAGLFQLSPLKTACLRHCRSPVAFFLARWRGGHRGAYGMGLQHGLYCAGCCWALMLLCFALGVMNLLWMLALTIFLCVEKIAPGGERSSRVSGLVFAAWGVWMVIGSDLFQG